MAPPHCETNPAAISSIHLVKMNAQRARTATAGNLPTAHILALLVALSLSSNKFAQATTQTTKPLSCRKLKKLPANNVGQIIANKSSDSSIIRQRIRDGALGIDSEYGT